MTTPEEPKEELGPFAYAGRLRAFVEKSRISVQVHLAHLERQGRDDELARSVLPRLIEIEDTIENFIRENTSTHPVWKDWAQNIRGCGAMNVGAVLSRVDITRLDTVSSMWAHFGYAPGQKRVAGEKINFDRTGKTWCWRLGESLLKQSPCFQAVYRQRKAYEVQRVIAAGGKVVPQVKGQEIVPPDMGALHVHERALRYMIKTWLACAFIVWRRAEGLPIVRPYPMAYLGHDPEHEYKPEDFQDRE